MDFLPTLAELAGASIPPSLHLDGQSISSILLSPSKVVSSPPVFYYRGNILYAVRWENYKAHFWTWTTPVEELARGIDHCPAANVVNVTTTDMRNHGQSPVIFHLRRDPGERYPLGQATKEYKTVLLKMNEIVAHHPENMVPGVPQLEWCDPAVMNWAPRGCQNIGKCEKIPPSSPQ